MIETSNVQEIKNTSDFLFLFEEENGLKFLTHDIKSSGLDFMDYVYLCERKILEEALGQEISFSSFRWAYADAIIFLFISFCLG